MLWAYWRDAAYGLVAPTGMMGAALGLGRGMPGVDDRVT